MISGKIVETVTISKYVVISASVNVTSVVSCMEFVDDVIPVVSSMEFVDDSISDLDSIR